MTLANMNKRILKNRLGWLKKWIEELEALPLETYEAFTQDRRKVRMAELALRRALEGLLDFGRYILKEEFGIEVAKYEEIPTRLAENGVMLAHEAKLLEKVAHYCQEIEQGVEMDPQKLYQICREVLANLLSLKEAYRQWTASLGQLRP